MLLLGATPTMAQQMPPIPVDSKVKIGHLDNGLTYYIRKNNFPEHVASFYIAQKVGSINENVRFASRFFNRFPVALPLRCFHLEEVSSRPPLSSNIFGRDPLSNVSYWNCRRPKLSKSP